MRNKNIWNIEVDKSDSWGWKNLLRIRDLIKNNVVHKIGDGQKTSLWYDNWSSLGALSQMVTNRDLYDARLHCELKVCDMVSNGNCLWPEEWYVKYHSITNLAVPNLDSNIEDKVVWRTKNGVEVDFSVSIANCDLKEQNARVD